MPVPSTEDAPSVDLTEADFELEQADPLGQQEPLGPLGDLRAAGRVISNLRDLPPLPQQGPAETARLLRHYKLTSGDRALDLLATHLALALAFVGQLEKRQRESEQATGCRG